jgi:beta-glucosidase
VYLKSLPRIAVYLFFVAIFLPQPTWALSFSENSAQKIDRLIEQMTLEEKVLLLGGNEFETYPISRLGIPALTMTDGAVGVHYDLSTAFPSGLSMGATFNPSLVREVASAMGDEARFRGRRTLLGPNVNICRQPFGGRNFETYGEDPYLSGQIAASFVRGVQSQNVVATVKHLTANDQETERQTIDTQVSVRALMEIYLPAFKKAVDAGSLGVMTAYNKINGSYASENRFLITDVLKGLWGFKGFVISDWESTHSTLAAANNGLDLEMPKAKYFDSKLIDAVAAGQVLQSTIDDKVRRILRVQFAIGLLGDPAKPLPAPLGPMSAQHKFLALRAAEESLVLLKNENRALPLDLSQLRSIALIGPNALEARTGGGGSSHVGTGQATSPSEEIKKQVGKSIRVLTALGARMPGNPALMPSEYLKPTQLSQERGLRGEYFSTPDFSGRPVITRVDNRFDFRDAIDWSLKGPYSVRWTGFISAPRSGDYALALDTWNHARVFVNEKEIASRWDGQGERLRKGSVYLRAGHWYPIRIEFYTDTDWASFYFGWETPAGRGLLVEAVEAARMSDVAVVFAGLGNDMEGEGVDRESMNMPEGQVELIKAVASVNPRTIVVLTSGNPLAIEQWLPSVPAVLQTWYPGEQGGAAIANTLLGRTNPSGKLPITYLRKWEDSPAYGNFPGKNGVVSYQEGIFVGYRHFDKNSIAPLFPFGHGLSYSKFEYSGLVLTQKSLAPGDPRVIAKFDLRNVGELSGSEVAQVYVGEQGAPLERPVKELKGFKKVFLRPGESKRLEIELGDEAFSYFDPSLMAWLKTPQGVFSIDVGSSSRDIRLNQRLILN